MTEIFLNLVNRSIAAGWIVAVVILLRLVLKKAPWWTKALLWGMAAVRLVCPISVKSMFSLLPSAETIPKKILSGPDFAVQTGITPIDSRVNAYLGDRYFEGVSVPVGNGQQVMNVLAAVWVCGVLLMLLSAAVSYLRMQKRTAMAVRLRDNIFQSEYAGAPFVLGFIRPRIYIPFHMREQELQYVLAHEQAHIRCRDYWWKPLGFLLLAVYWFHPLLWLAYILFCWDIELACDEKVIGSLDHEGRADYTQALLNCSAGRRRSAVCPLAFGETGVKRRIKNVLHYKKPGFWVIAAAVLACLAVAVCFLTNPVRRRFTLNIRVPAGSTAAFVYSHEQISSMGKRITISAGEGLGDTEVVLKPVETGEGTEAVFAEEPVYLTAGMPVKLDVQKGVWYQVGVNVQNPTEEEFTVKVQAEPVVVRIASEAAQSPVQVSQEKQGEEEAEASGTLEERMQDSEEIASLFDSIEALPLTSSKLKDYIQTHDKAYEELLSYGEPTLEYCFEKFLEGGQDGLRGKIMEAACKDIISSQGFGIEDVLYETGQDWFHTFLENSGKLAEQYADEELKEKYPASWLLMELVEEQAQ